MKKILILEGPTDYVESWLQRYTQPEFANLKITALTDEQQETLDEALNEARDSYYENQKHTGEVVEYAAVQYMRDELSKLTPLLTDREPVVNPPSTNATNYMED